MLQDFKKHLMTGISYMIPMVVAGGILGALAKGLGGWEVGNLAPDASGATIFSYLNAFDWGQFWWAISKLSDFAMMPSICSRLRCIASIVMPHLSNSLA